MPETAITVFPRIHVGLMSMHADAPRINGGIGFAVNGPSAFIKTVSSPRLEVIDLRPEPMGAPELEQLKTTLASFREGRSLDRGAVVTIEGALKTHVGMGSATALRLAALEGLSRLNDVEVSRKTLVSTSGRGGTSGIGINSYFDGGLVCDLGRKADGSGFAPSSQASESAPLALPTIDMPDWPILLCVPRSIPPKSQAEEIAFFERTTPLPEKASYETCYIAMFEIYASAREANFPAFCSGIERMQETAWKQAEREQYGAELRSIAEQLRKTGADCVGMSSLGPMLYCLGAATKMPELSKAAAQAGCDVFQVRPANHGRKVLN